MEAYCGKNCGGCDTLKSGKCAGCMAESGERKSTACAIAACCARKNYPSCESCSRCNYCTSKRVTMMKQEGKFGEPEELSSSPNGKLSTSHGHIHELVNLLLWLTVINWGLNLLEPEEMGVMYWIIRLLNLGCMVFYAVVLFWMRSASKRFCAAGMGLMVNQVLGLAQDLVKAATPNTTDIYRHLFEGTLDAALLERWLRMSRLALVLAALAIVPLLFASFKEYFGFNQLLKDFGYYEEAHKWKVLWFVETAWSILYTVGLFAEMDWIRMISAIGGLAAAVLHIFNLRKTKLCLEYAYLNAEK